MHIHDDHRHYGSALIQIAEHSHFTAINAFRYQGTQSRCGFRVNKDIGVHIRYRSDPQGQSIPVYPFTFTRDNIAELRDMKRRLDRVFLGLVCVHDRVICCLSLARFERFVAARREAKGEREDEYSVEVCVPAGCRLRVGISPPNTKGHWLQSVVVPRNAFPNGLFAHLPSYSRSVSRGGRA